jgi:hypothetical protein
VQSLSIVILLDELFDVPAKVYFCPFTGLFQIAQGVRQPSLLMKRGLATSPAPLLLRLRSGVSLASPSHRRHCMRSHQMRCHIHLDLLGLRFLALRYAERQHAILIIGLDGLRLH